MHDLDSPVSGLNASHLQPMSMVDAWRYYDVCGPRHYPAHSRCDPAGISAMVSLGRPLRDVPAVAEDELYITTRLLYQRPQ